jgi:protease-4
LERTLGKVGITLDGVGTTPLADALRLDRNLKPEASEILQLSVDNAYSTFVGHVAQAREKSFEEIDAVAQGRVWAGKDATGNGLVDKLGSYREAMDAAAARAGLGEDYGIEYIEPPLGWRQALARQAHILVARFTSALLPKESLLGDMRRMLSPLERELTRLARFNDPKQVYSYCACSVQ